MQNNLSIVILAAGKGTRMKSDLPKVLHKINGKPMIDQVISTAKKLNPFQIITVIGYKHEILEDHLKNQNLNFAYQFNQKGTGHAVSKTKNFFNNHNGDVLILSGDVPMLSYKTLDQLWKHHINNNATASVLTAELDDATGYGRIIRDDGDNLKKIVEHKDASDSEKTINEINTGIYIFDSKALFLELPKLKNNNIQGEYYLPDVLLYILKGNKKVSLLKTKNYYEIQGVNNKEQLHSLNVTKK